jgi:hypothetical protein
VTSPLLAYPDIEAGLVSAFADLASTGTSTPGDLATRLPFLRIACIGGRDDGTTDLSHVDIDAFAATKAAAAVLAEQVRQRLVSRKSVRIPGYVIDRATTDLKPHQVPYSPTPPPYRYTASYSVSARR